MGVSRTPVREAIRKLEKEGLVTIEPRKGAYASDISLKDMVDTLEVREDLEGLAAALAAERMTDEQIQELTEISQKYREAVRNSETEKMISYDEQFHRYIVACSGNKTLLQISGTVQELALRFRYLYYDDFSRYEFMPVEHQRIIDAISRHNVEEARDVADVHVKKLKEFVIREGEEEFK